MIETWKPIPGYEGFYSVSDQGRIRSEARTMRHAWKENAVIPVKEKIRVLSPNSRGYLSFQACRDGAMKTLRVHVCVLEAFVGPRPSDFHARHMNGDQLDNRLENLSWGTAKENKADQFVHGTAVRGERQWLSKLTTKLVLEIRNSTESNAECARRLGVTRGAVRDVRRRHTWKHV